jgi:membrane-bound serine protease (ClpP class)
MRKRWLSGVLFASAVVAVWSGLLGVEVLRAKEKSSQAWMQVDIGIIGTASADILEKALEEVDARHAAGLLIRLDTPGGSLDATRVMVQAMLAAPFPIVVWVGPGGARAGSAGAFITLAANVAAMAPGTNIGAAHPIDASGQNIPGEEAARKAQNDTVAFMESIAKARGRNVELAASFVETSVSVTAEEAFEQKVIDLVARDARALMKALHGRQVEIKPGVSVTLDTETADLIPVVKTFRQKVLEILSNPNVFYLLFLAGVIGLGYELTHPGVLFPGVAGGICLILAFIATSVLPISWGALALILLGVLMMVAEVFLPSFGVLGIGGMVAFILGSIFVVDPSNAQGLRVSLWAIGPGVLFVGAASATIGWLVLRSRNRKVLTGEEALVGEKVKVVVGFSEGRGKVRCQGELWEAVLSEESSTAPEVGAGLEVVGRRGMVLVVRRI